MSSRVLRDPLESVRPLAWNRIAPGRVPATATPRGGDSPEEGLRRRIRELEAELEQRERRGFEAGLRQSEAASAQKAAQALDAAVERISRSLAELAALKPRLRREAEEDVVKLALAVARRLLHRELSIDPEALLGIVKAAMAKLDSRELARVRTDPELADTVRCHLGKSGSPARIEVISDATLEKGAMLFETSRGTLDASLETQLQEIQCGLIDRLRGGNA